MYAEVPLREASEIEIVSRAQFSCLTSEPGYLLEDGHLLICADPALYKQCKAAVDSHRLGQDAPHLRAACDLAVVLNGEYHSAWHIKFKEFDPQDVKYELTLNAAIVKLNKKASVAWHFRRMLVQIDFDYEREVQLIETVCNQHRQHYFAWQYRGWLLDQVLPESLVEREEDSLLQWCEQHVSDSSGFHLLFRVTQRTGRYRRAYEWVCRLCVSYYGPAGLYADQAKPGLESTGLLRLKLARELKEDDEYCEGLPGPLFQHYLAKQSQMS
jgi:hypothetical protein